MTSVARYAALAATIAVGLSAPLAQAQDRSDDVYWVLELAIKDGRGDELAPLAEEMSAATETETGAFAYEWFQNGDAVHLYERFDDAQGAMTHLGNFEANFAERFFDLLDATAWTVYGPASDELKAAITPMGAVFFDKVDGFAR